MIIDLSQIEFTVKFYYSQPNLNLIKSMEFMSREAICEG